MHEDYLHTWSVDANCFFLSSPTEPTQEHWVKYLMTQILTQTQEELFTRGAIHRWNILLKEDFPSQEEGRQDWGGIQVGCCGEGGCFCTGKGIKLMTSWGLFHTYYDFMRIMFSLVGRHTVDPQETLVQEPSRQTHWYTHSRLLLICCGCIWQPGGDPAGRDTWPRAII